MTEQETLEHGVYTVVYSCPDCSHSGFAQINYPSEDRAYCSVCEAWAEIIHVGKKMEDTNEL